MTRDDSYDSEMPVVILILMIMMHCSLAVYLLQLPSAAKSQQDTERNILKQQAGLQHVME